MPTPRKTTARKAPLALTLIAFGALAGPAAHAQIVLSSSTLYNQHHSDGYDIFDNRSYAVVVPATFNNNDASGLGVGNTSVTVSGGDFSGNHSSGLYAQDFSRVTVNGGHFSGNLQGGLFAFNHAAITVNGGVFTGNQSGLNANEFSAIDIHGGDFSGNTRYFGTSYDLIADAVSSITLYGTGLTFDGLPGITTLTSGFARTGTISGTLQYNAAPSSTTYEVVNLGTITLVSLPAVPEPSPCALAIPALALLGLALRARRRPAA